MIGIGVTAAAALITVLFSPPVSPASPPPLLPSSPPLASFGPTDSRDYGRGSAGLSAYAAAGHPVLGSQDYGFSEGQCTWFVASVVPESQNPCPKETTGRNALNWLGFARAKGMPIGDEPLPGAIMCLRASGYGHVAVVLAVTADTVTGRRRQLARPA